MKEKKLKLEDLKVESFVTALEDKYINALIGATGNEGCNTEDDACDTLDEVCGAQTDTAVAVCTPNTKCIYNPITTCFATD